MLKMDLEYQKEILFVRLNGSLTKNGSQKINNYLVPVLAKHKIKKVIINLANLKSIDKRGIFALLNLKCTVKNNKGKIIACHIPKCFVANFNSLHLKTVLSEKAALNLIEV